MYRLLILTFFVCFIYQEDEATIAWSEDLELQWSDFKGEPKPIGDAVATTASGISFGYSTTKSSIGLEDFTFHITAHFYPNKSWHINEPLSNIVLAHERLHFDITELHGRMFRQRISNSKFTNEINREMQQIHDAIIIELSEMQKKYDTETWESRLNETRQLPFWADEETVASLRTRYITRSN